MEAVGEFVSSNPGLCFFIFGCSVLLNLLLFACLFIRKLQVEVADKIIEDQGVMISKLRELNDIYKNELEARDQTEAKLEKGISVIVNFLKSL